MDGFTACQRVLPCRWSTIRSGYLGAKFVSNLIPIMGLLIPFYIKCTLDKLKCPKCEMPVTYQGKILGESYFGGFLNRHCKNCGWDLDDP